MRLCEPNVFWAKNNELRMTKSFHGEAEAAKTQLQLDIDHRKRQPEKGWKRRGRQGAGGWAGWKGFISYLLERVEMRMEKDELGGHFVSTNCEGRLQKLSLGMESVL